MNTLKLWALCLCLTLGAPVYAQQDDHDANETAGGHGDEGEHGDHDEEGGEEGEGAATEITVAQQRVAGIVIEALRPQSLAAEISAPGEVTLNAYLTRKVTPRITAQIMQRHVRLGERVTIGQALVTLSSVQLAEAQGELQVAEREWRRVESLGKSTVSERRYTEAQVAQQQAISRVGSYGMTAEQIKALLEGSTAVADGTFQLLATQPGTVIRDDFIEGEFVEPGRELFEISDETQIWVEANLTPEEALGVKTGARARVKARETWFEGRVVQAYHVLNEITRTLGVRIEVANPDERLHPGLFVETRIEGAALVDVLAVPEEAVLRGPDGDWVVLVEEEAGKFESLEIDVVRTVAGMAVIEGVPAGTRIVTQGAFFVQSEIAKSGFEIHNH